VSQKGEAIQFFPEELSKNRSFSISSQSSGSSAASSSLFTPSGRCLKSEEEKRLQRLSGASTQIRHAHYDAIQCPPKELKADAIQCLPAGYLCNFSSLGLLNVARNIARFQFSV